MGGVFVCVYTAVQFVPAWWHGNGLVSLCF